MQAESLVSSARSFESREESLVADCVRQLSEASSAVTALNEDFARRSDSSARLHEQLAEASARALDAEQRARQVRHVACQWGHVVPWPPPPPSTPPHPPRVFLLSCLVGSVCSCPFQFTS